jgi:ABC-type sugar transport system ATPase subunit
MASNGSSVSLEGVSKKFSDVIALYPVDLAVRAGTGE